LKDSRCKSAAGMNLRSVIIFLNEQGQASAEGHRILVPQKCPRNV
jgi:hypothetical protein